MAFNKTASVEHIAVIELDDGGLIKKRACGKGSYYADGDAKIDIAAILKRNADNYKISSNPSDYLFEAIRANTASVPNDNHDAFPRAELLRFDTRLGMPVYMTYAEKPHHVNHRADDPTRARGIIIDAHYNDDTPALEECGGCGHKTADVSERDESGLHCRKCGSTVKDESVEILLAIDTRKDAIFAEGVRTGQLNAGSMGCQCAATVCNVCSNVARSRSDFCKHIAGSAKGSWWVQASEGWESIELEEAQHRFAEANTTFEPQSKIAMRVGDLHVRKAFENCIGVGFEEFSRVDQPADTTALQQEVLSRSAGANRDLQQESEQLIARARRKSRKAQLEVAQHFVVVKWDDHTFEVGPTLEQALANLDYVGKSSDLQYVELDADSEDAAIAKAQSFHSGWMPIPPEMRIMAQRTAMKFHVVRVDGNPQDTYAAESLEAAKELAGADDGSKLETCEVEAEDAGAARLMCQGEDAMWRDADTIINIGDEGAAPEVLEEPELDAPELDFEDLGDQPIGEEEMSPEEMGIMPEGASNVFEASYKDWSVRVSEAGTASIYSPEGPVMLARSTAKTDAERMAFGQEIKASLDARGLTRTTLKYKGLLSPRIAQIAEHGVSDMVEGKDVYQHNSLVQDADLNDMQEPFNVAPKDSRENAEGDMQEPRSPEFDSVVVDHEADHDSAGPMDSAVKDGDSSDMREPRKPVPTTSLEDGEVDHKMARAFKQKMAALEATIEDREAVAARSAVNTFVAGLRVAGRRFALNREIAPLKESLGVVLTNGRIAGYTAAGQPLEFQPLADDLALHLIEAAYKEAGNDDLNALINRAAELAQRGDTYLREEYADLGKQAHIIPPVTAAGSVSEADTLAHTQRQAMAQGNMSLASSAKPQGQTRQSLISAAVQGGAGTTAQLHNRIRS